MPKLIPSSAQVITTRTYDDRLDTISHVRDAGISVCSGGILGLGESDEDRVGLIWEASKYVPGSLFVVWHILSMDVHSMPEHPESFPVNALVPIKGTPLENNEVGISSIAPTSLWSWPKWFSACFSPCASPYDRHRKNRPSNDDHPACGR